MRETQELISSRNLVNGIFGVEFCQGARRCGSGLRAASYKTGAHHIRLMFIYRFTSGAIETATPKKSRTAEAQTNLLVIFSSTLHNVP
jgi:hypothetical protein